MNSTFQIDTAYPDEGGGAGYAFHIVGLNGVVTSAIVRPTSLTPGLVSGVVEWQDPLSMSSVVSTEGDPSPWVQRLFLIYAAAGPTSVRVVPELAAHKWAIFCATFPDPSSEAQGNIRISLKSARWEIALASTDPNGLTVRIQIPAALRDLDAGSVMLEMATRLARKRSSPA